MLAWTEQKSYSGQKILKNSGLPNLISYENKALHYIVYGDDLKQNLKILVVIV